MKKIIVILIAMLATTGLVAQNGNVRYLKIDKGNDNYETLNLDNGVSYSIKTEYDIDNKLVINIYDGDNNLLATYPESVKVYPMYDANGGGVLINGVRWATRNVDMPGIFAAKPEDAGMFYQWNRKIGWSSTDPMINSNGGTTWDSSFPSGTEWEPANDPSPTGYRVPTMEEIESLLNETYVERAWTTVNGWLCIKFTDKNNGNSIFLPAAGWRSGGDGALNFIGVGGKYWSSTEYYYSTSLAFYLSFYSGTAECSQNNKTLGFSVRPVIKSPDNVTFTISDADNITHASATFNASVTSTTAVTDKGICYSSTNNTPTTSDPKVSKGSGTGSYTATLTDLTDNTLYYARPYAIVNTGGTYYGEVKTFTTENDGNYALINGVKWATHNVDMPETFAANPEDAGMFYQWNRKIAWSATVPGPGVPIPGWDNTPPSGTTWEPANDPSPTGYRVPTREEIQSLLDKTYVENVWTTENGVNGRRFTDKYNGNSIFLPAAGYRYDLDGTLYGVGAYGDYWSSTEYSAGYAYGLHFSSGNADWINGYEANGFSVRPVAE